jgi:hypothetical protein
MGEKWELMVEIMRCGAGGLVIWLDITREKKGGEKKTEKNENRKKMEKNVRKIEIFFKKRL